MVERTLVEEYIRAVRKRDDLLLRVMERFLNLPRDEWKITGKLEEITDYEATIGSYFLTVRCDASFYPDEDVIYRAEVYRRKHFRHHGGLVFKFNEDEAIQLFYKVDEIVRGLPLEDVFNAEIMELNVDSDSLSSIILNMGK